MTTSALNHLWSYLQGLSLSQSDREWLAGKHIESSYMVNPYEVSPTGDSFWAYARNVKAVEEDIAASHKPDAKFAHLETKDDVKQLIDSL